jgi:hypothetical protein
LIPYCLREQASRILFNITKKEKELIYEKTGMKEKSKKSDEKMENIGKGKSISF